MSAPSDTLTREQLLDAIVEFLAGDDLLGIPLRSDVLLGAAGGDRRVAMDAVGLAVANLLPPAYRGVYTQGLSEPQRVLAAARAGMRS